jgi:flagellar biogenesis protein FliO
MFPPSGMLAATATAAVSNTDAHVSVFSLLARLLISLFVVLMVLWVLAQIVRRKGLPGSRGGGRAVRRQVDVLARQSLGKGQTLVTVRLDDRVLLLGLTAQNITTLSELDPAAYGIAPAPGSGSGQLLELEAVVSDGSDPDSYADADADADADAYAYAYAEQSPTPLPSTSTSASSTSSSAGSMSSTMFSWNQRLDRLRDRTVRR